MITEFKSWLTAQFADMRAQHAQTRPAATDTAPPPVEQSAGADVAAELSALAAMVHGDDERARLAALVHGGGA